MPLGDCDTGGERDAVSCAEPVWEAVFDGVESRLALDETVPTLALAVAEVVGKALRLTVSLTREDAETRLLLLPHAVADDVIDSTWVARVEALIPSDTEIVLEAVCVEERAADCDVVTDRADEDDGASLTVVVVVTPESEKTAVFVAVLDDRSVDVPRALAESRPVDKVDAVAAIDGVAEFEVRFVRLTTLLEVAEPDERPVPDSDAVTEADTVVDSQARELLDVRGDFDDETVAVADSDCAEALREGLPVTVFVERSD